MKEVEITGVYEGDLVLPIKCPRCGFEMKHTTIQTATTPYPQVFRCHECKKYFALRLDKIVAHVESSRIEYEND